MSLNKEIEVQIDSDPCLLAWTDQLFVGCEDGSIKSFSADLKQKASWKAHEVQLFALEAGKDKVYSASNDGRVMVWSPSGDRLGELRGPGSDVGALRLHDNHLYVGDEAGGVIVYDNGVLKAAYNVLEEVKDILVSPPFMMTGRDLDVTITEVKPDSSRFRFTTCHTMEGRPPLRVAGSKLLMVSRDGRSIRIHDNSTETKFKLLQEQQASDMILTSLAVEKSGCFVWSGGWDGRVKRWTVDDAAAITAGAEVNLGACVNALVTSDEPNAAYAAVSGGKILKIKSR